MNPFENGMIGTFGWIRVYEDPKMVEQFRHPRSKGKRIQAKWRKNPANFRPARHIMQNKRTGDIYCHPAVAQELRRTINARAF